MVLCNMSMEMGAKAGVCFPDKKTMDFLEGRVRQAMYPVVSDKEAPVAKGAGIGPDRPGTAGGLPAPGRQRETGGGGGGDAD